MSSRNLKLSDPALALIGNLLFWAVILMFAAVAARVAGLEAFSNWTVERGIGLRFRFTGFRRQIGVFAWSGSLGLVVVIAMSMVLAMVAAGFAGALVPILLTRVGQDPAQSSPIILTTVTDVAGFFSFLGIATLLAGML